MDRTGLLRSGNRLAWRLTRFVFIFLVCFYWNKIKQIAPLARMSGLCWPNLDLNAAKRTAAVQKGSKVPLSIQTRFFFIVAVMVVLFSDSGFAQVLPGDSPNAGIGGAVANSRSKPIFGLSSGPANSEPSYQSRSQPSASRKPPSDPWAGVRQTTPTYDRHRAY